LCWVSINVCRRANASVQTWDMQPNERRTKVEYPLVFDSAKLFSTM
jgi:hypothetical protein